MRRGEVWWAIVDERCPVVILSEGGSSELSAMRIVAPATEDEKRGFLVLSGAEAADPATMRRMIDSAGSAVRAVGVEVAIGVEEGLSEAGVVRVALPLDGRVFCTWLTGLTADHLVERAGELGAVKLDQLGNALRLAGLSPEGKVLALRRSDGHGDTVGQPDRCRARPGRGARTP
jgi:mRNA interferase MazF